MTSRAPRAPALSVLVSLALLGPLAARAAEPEKLWHEWYLIRVNGVASGYFEETAERRPGEKEIAVTQKWVEKGAGQQLSETYIGSVAEESALAPVAFFVDRKGGKTYKIDGRVKAGQLTATFKPADAATAKSTEQVQVKAGTYLSSLVPLAIARQFSAGGAFAFTAVVEDDGDMNVTVRKGMAEIQKEERKIGKERCRRVKIAFGGDSQEWWIAKNGRTCQVSFPSSGTKLEESDEKSAKAALGVK